MNIYKDPTHVVHYNEVDDDWPSLLRWLLAVLDEDDTRISFISGCLSFVTRQGSDGLSERQMVGCKKIFDNVCQDFDTYQLDCLVGETGKANA